jgi:hypothetical protein
LSTALTAAPLSNSLPAPDQSVAHSVKLSLSSLTHALSLINLHHLLTRLHLLLLTIKLLPVLFLTLTAVKRL